MTNRYSVATQNIGETLIAQKKYKEAIRYLKYRIVLFHQWATRMRKPG